VRKADNLPPSCSIVIKSGKLNFLELSGSVQACNGTDLPFTFLNIYTVLSTVVAKYTSEYSDWFKICQ